MNPSSNVSSRAQGKDELALTLGVLPMRLLSKTNLYAVLWHWQ
jgi:hypothetical protein